VWKTTLGVIYTTQGVKYFPRCEILPKVWNKVWNNTQGVKYHPRCKITLKEWNNTQGVKYHSRCEILSKVWNTTQGVKNYPRFDILHKVWNTTQGVKHYPPHMTLTFDHLTLNTYTNHLPFIWRPFKPIVKYCPLLPFKVCLQTLMSPNVLASV